MYTTSRPPDIAALTDILFRRAVDTPDALAFDVCGERLTWSQLLDGALGAARALRDRGVQRGLPCALVLSTTPEFLWAFFGASLIGAVPVAINPRLPPAQVRRRLDELGAAAVVRLSLPSDEDSAQLAGAIPIVTAAEIRGARAIDRRDVHVPSPEELSHLQLTSGTTGEPRAVRLRHRNVMLAVENAVEILDPSPTDVLVGWLPLHHDLGLIRFVCESMYFGTPCYLLEPAMTTLPSWLDTMTRVGGTITAAPDFVYRIVSRLVDPRTVSIRSLRVATSGGEVVRQSSISAFEERFGVPGVVRPGYGLAEATLGVTCTRAGEPIAIDDTGAVSCGRTPTNVRVRIADAGDRDLPAGVRGRILVSGGTVCDGYLNDLAATADILRDGWLDTGDVGALDATGRLFVHGRTRAMIKRAGATIAPREIEELVDGLDGVRRSAAVGMDVAPDALTEAVHLVVEVERAVKPEARAALSATIADAVRRGLGFAPHAVHLVAPGRIPRTTTGKTQYAALKSALASGLKS